MNQFVETVLRWQLKRETDAKKTCPFIQLINNQKEKYFGMTEARHLSPRPIPLSPSRALCLIRNQSAATPGQDKCAFVFDVLIEKKWIVKTWII